MDARHIERLVKVEADVQHLKTWRDQADMRMDGTDAKFIKWDLQKAKVITAIMVWAFMTGGGTVSLEHLLQLLGK